jgi:hypothetical protein
MWKAVFTILGGVIGPILGYFTVYCLVLASESGSCMDKFAANACGWVFGVPLGAVVFGVLGFCRGRVLDHRAKDSVAATEEELQMLAERGEVAKVRVELTSYVNRDAIRGDLEKVGFLEIDERTPLEKFLSSGLVNWVTGTINAARIEELAALSFVKSVEAKGSMDGQGG